MKRKLLLLAYLLLLPLVLCAYLIDVVCYTIDFLMKLISDYCVKFAKAVEESFKKNFQKGGAE